MSAVVMREPRGARGGFTLAIEAQDERNVPTHHVILRTTPRPQRSKGGELGESARQLAERELTPSARRVAGLLGLPEPRWV